MKLSSIKYLTREGLKNVWVNRLMTISSIGVLVACMVLIGLAVLLSLNVTQIIGNLEQQNVVMVFFDDYNAARYDLNKRQVPEGAELDENGLCAEMYLIHNSDEAKAVCEEIKAIPNIADVQYVSKEEALEITKKNMNDKADVALESLEGEDNPLSDGARVTMVDLELFDTTLEKIKNVKGVNTIQAQNDLADAITSIKNGIFIAGIAIISILLIISLVIVSNTIRVTMYNRKLEISIMKAVGATDGFIRLPFVVEGIAIGIISAIISEGLLYCCYRVAAEAILSNAGSFQLISYSSQAFMLFGIFIAIGVLAGTVGSLIMISKYLKREGSEFAAF
ncbi:MAG: permease-like cell division protein FtsX [Acutalibacteraceae bacterium]|nr:permease-like cell division protein FtsX [Acutalibacteraceae bacterium]